MRGRSLVGLAAALVTASVLVAVLASAEQAAARRLAPLRRPQVSVKLLTVDPVSVLQQGRFAVRLTARRTASVRFNAFVRGAAVAATRVVKVRARRRAKRTTLRLPLSAAARRALDACSSTVVTLTVRAVGFGSPKLSTGRRTKTRLARFTFVCRDGRLVPLDPSRTGSGGEVRPDAGGSGAVGDPGTTSGRPDGPGSTGRSYEVGIARRSIATDPDGTWKGAPVFLGGYGFGGATPVTEGRSATGVLGDGPTVDAFVVGDGKTVTAVADLQVQGWFTARRNDANGIIDMRKAVAAATGGKLPAERIVIQSDHSHSGADAMGVWGGVPTAFVEHMRKQAEAAILDAWFNRRPGRLVYGTTDGTDLLTNQFSYDEANKSLDGDVRVLQARDAKGVPFATLLNFSAHSTVLGADNRLISGDWPQAANRIMRDRRARFGDAMTMIGTFGRTQPAREAACPQAGGSAEQGLCKIDGYAKQVVDLAERALDGARPIGGAPVVDARSYLIQDPATNAPILGFSTVGPTAGATVGLPFNRSALPPWQAGNVIGTVTGTIRIGDVLVSSVPGEIYPQIALKVRDTVKGIRPGGFMTAGLADDQLGYLIAPFEAYPQPVRATFLSKDFGDEILACGQAVTQPATLPDACRNPVEPIGNDNYFFNVSHTMGERVTCSLLRGADELLTPASSFRASYARCALFANDMALPAGSDVTLSGSGSVSTP